MKIVARLNSVEGGCDYTGHFKKYWIENKTLHPKAKAIPVEVQKTFLDPAILVFDSQGLIILEQKGPQIDPAKLQEFILLQDG